MGESEQLSLLRTATNDPTNGPTKGPTNGAAKGRRPLRVAALARDHPVARVVVDIPLAHLDHPFDYAVPEAMAVSAQPGVRVRVRFAGQDVDAFVTHRLEGSDHPGRLTALRRVVSPEPVLTPQVLRLARAVADRYAGTLTDVLRLAIPPRHAAAERQSPPAAPPAMEQDGAPAPRSAVPPVAPGPWRDYPAGSAFLSRLARGESPRAVWTALPGPAWAEAVAVAAATTAAAGRGVVVVLPDHRDVESLESALVAVQGPGAHARLGADLGPQARYRSFLAALRGRVRVVVGTRAAAYAPVADLGLVVIWDDGDDLHAEPRAPYPHVREVLALRAEQEGAAMLVGGWSVSAESAQHLWAGWARPIEAARGVRRARWPRVVVASDDHPDADPAAAAAHLPPVAWRAIHDGLARGPVLVQVPRAGYLPAVACQTCRRPARCPHCAGPVRLLAPVGAVSASGAGSGADSPSPSVAGRQGPPGCGWCGRTLLDWQCPTCGGDALRASRVGVQRTAEELGRAFPATTVVVSRAERVLPVVRDRPALVLSTPGVEPSAEHGYAAAVLLDGDAFLSRPDLRAGEEALRRWRAAAALVRPGPDGGLVVVAADAAAPAVAALVRGDPAGFAERERVERADLGLPPAVTAVTVVGAPEAVAALLGQARLPGSADVLGPVPVDDHQRRGADPRAPAVVRTLVRVPLVDGPALARSLRDAAAVRSARREPGPVRIQVDARDLG